MNATQRHHQAGRNRVFGIIVGGYGCLWAIVGLLILIFGLNNLSAPELGGLVAVLALLIGAVVIFFAALLLIGATGLWQGRIWAPSLVAILAIAQLLGALVFLFQRIWVIGLFGTALSVAALWYIFQSRAGRSTAR